VASTGRAPWLLVIARLIVLTVLCLWLWLTLTELPDSDRLDGGSCAWICLDPP
jgi:hypothetical protein